jgi:hypothetical protein
MVLNKHFRSINAGKLWAVWIVIGKTQVCEALSASVGTEEEIVHNFLGPEDVTADK